MAMKIDLSGKTAVITGAGGGIGMAVADKLASSGMKLVLLGGNNVEKLSKNFALLSEKTECLMLPGDLTDHSFLSLSVKEIVSFAGGVDVLVNNAGVAQHTAYEDVTESEFDRIMSINVKVPYFLTQKLLPYLCRSSSASVINIGSVVSHLGYPQQSVYSASKHALLGLTKSLAREYYKLGIRVHAICPGGVYTDMVKLSRPDLSSEGMIMPDEIAEIIHFLLVNRGNAVIDEILVHRLNKEPFLV